MVALPNYWNVGKNEDLTYGMVSPTRASTAAMERTPPMFVPFYLDN